MKRHEARTNNVVLHVPHVHINSIQDSEERKAPGDTIDDNTLSLREELVYNSSKK